MHFETGQYPDESLGVVNHAGFTHPPGGNNASEYHVLNDHSYCCQLSPSVCASGEPPKNMSVECKNWHNDRIFTRALDAERLQIPLLISEFGACFGTEECFREITQVADACDKVMSGWAYWQFKFYQDLTTTGALGNEGFYNNDGSLQHIKVKALARTYLQKV